MWFMQCSIQFLCLGAVTNYMGTNLLPILGVQFDVVDKHNSKIRDSKTVFDLRVCVGGSFGSGGRVLFHLVMLSGGRSMH